MSVINQDAHTTKAGRKMGWRQSIHFSDPAVEQVAFCGRIENVIQRKCSRRLAAALHFVSQVRFTTAGSIGTIAVRTRASAGLARHCSATGVVSHGRPDRPLVLLPRESKARSGDSFSVMLQTSIGPRRPRAPPAKEKNVCASYANGIEISAASRPCCCGATYWLPTNQCRVR